MVGFLWTFLLNPASVSALQRQNLLDEIMSIIIPSHDLEIDVYWSSVCLCAQELIVPRMAWTFNMGLIRRLKPLISQKSKLDKNSSSMNLILNL
jgi:hypothetical protein